VTAIDWPNDPPADCPFPRSTAFSGVRLTGRTAMYTDADTWDPSWASDGESRGPRADNRNTAVAGEPYRVTRRLDHRRPSNQRGGLPVGLL
jgi:hypothetical protein